VEVDPVTVPKLTPAARRALDVVAAHDGTARESNITDPDRGLVYWQSVRRLFDLGLIDYRFGPKLGPTLGLTDAGRSAVEGSS